VKKYGVRQSVCPIRMLQLGAAGLLLWVRRLGDIVRLQQQVCGGRMRAVPRCQRTQTAQRRAVRRVWIKSTLDLGPDSQNILQQSYDYLMIMAKLRSTYDGRLIYKTSYNERKAFHR